MKERNKEECNSMTAFVMSDLSLKHHHDATRIHWQELVACHLALFFSKTTMYHMCYVELAISIGTYPQNGRRDLAHSNTLQSALPPSETGPRQNAQNLDSSLRQPKCTRTPFSLSWASLPYTFLATWSPAQAQLTGLLKQPLVHLYCYCSPHSVDNGHFFKLVPRTYAFNSNP